MPYPFTLEKFIYNPINYKFTKISRSPTDNTLDFLIQRTDYNLVSLFFSKILVTTYLFEWYSARVYNLNYHRKFEWCFAQYKCLYFQKKVYRLFNLDVLNVSFFFILFRACTQGLFIFFLLTTHKWFCIKIYSSIERCFFF